MTTRRFLTVQQAVEQVEFDSDEEEAEIAILPPCDNLEISDPEDINEDVLDAALPADVCGELDVILISKTTEEAPDSDDELLANINPVKIRPKKPRSSAKKWNHDGQKKVHLMFRWIKNYRSCCLMLGLI